MEAELRVLTTANRDSLLAASVDSIRRRLPEAPAMLARLAQLNPALAAQVHLKQDALSNLTLRMLVPVGTPAETPVPSFIIISYCWHYPTWPLPPAATPMHPRWRISRPMVDAVLEEGGVRAPGEGVWLDQLCINQTDAHEKRIAIGAMDVLYRSARRLVILLEDVQFTADEEASARTFAGFYADMASTARSRGLEGAAKGAFVDGYFPARLAALPAAERARVQAAARPAAMRLLGARWFSRAWCAHESRVVTHSRTNNPLFFCFGSDGGLCRFEFRFVHYWALRLCDDEPAPPIGAAFYVFLADPDPQTLRQRWHRIQSLMNRATARTPHMQHLTSVRTFGCLLPGDLVSVALNSAGIPLAYDGRIVHRGDIIWTFAAIAIAAGDVSALSLLGEDLVIPDDDDDDNDDTAATSRREVVSWMLLPAGGVVDETPVPPHCALSITGVTRTYIELDLLLLAGQPTKPTETSMATAAALLAIVDQHDAAAAAAAGTTAAVTHHMALLTTVLNDQAGNPPGTRPRLLAVYAQTFLALGLDCGLDWLVRFPAVMAAQTQGPDGWLYGQLGEDADEVRVGAAATALLAGLGIATGPTEADAEAGAYWHGAVRFLTLVLDDRLKSFTVHPRRVQVAADDWAITTSGADRSWLAVPVALADLLHWHKRVWHVDPFDPAGPPEQPEHYLPDVALTAAAATIMTAHETLPLRSSDDGDGRAPRNDACAAWRVRRRLEIFGCRPLIADGTHVVRLPQQRVYGSKDYDWAAAMAAYRAIDAAAAAVVAQPME